MPGTVPRTDPTSPDIVAPAVNPYSIYATKAKHHNSEDSFKEDVSNFGGLGSVLPSVNSILGDEDVDIRGAASGYSVPDEESQEYYASYDDANYDEAQYGDDEDLSTVFNPNDLSGYGKQEQAVPEDYEYEYYYDDDYDIDQMPEMIDLRGTQPLVIDNYSGKRRR